VLLRVDRKFFHPDAASNIIITQILSMTQAINFRQLSPSTMTVAIIDFLEVVRIQ
jgi:hypothetical protein